MPEFKPASQTQNKHKLQLGIKQARFLFLFPQSFFPFSPLRLGFFFLLPVGLLEFYFSELKMNTRNRMKTPTKRCPRARLPPPKDREEIEK